MEPDSSLFPILFVETYPLRVPFSTRSLRPLPKANSFTIVEMMVAIAVLSILLVLASQIITRTSSIWVYSNFKMAEGREARVAFNSLVARLGSATVDQYYGYTYTNAGTSAQPSYIPSTYGRRSELRFVSGPSAAINTTISASPTHAVFFAAPLGIVSNTASYGHLPSLINVCGYYVQWSNVDLERPSILPGTANYRFRLMQFVQPAESMSIYSQTIPFSAANTNGNYPAYSLVTGTGWQNTAMTSTPQGVRPLANNIIALLLLPSPSTTNSTGVLAPGFVYSSEVATAGATTDATTSVNRTPPVMRVVMYAIDEKSALKLPQSSTMPNLYVSTSGTTLFTNSAVLYPNTALGDIGDLARFEQTLTANKLTFRRFDAAVELPRQPWSTQNLGNWNY